MTTSDTASAHPRDADGTRQRLLEAARIRFARDGYSTTTVRDIAADAGVNVALISRYFGSKEGLFEQCVTLVGKELDRPTLTAPTFDGIVRALTHQVIEYSTGDGAAQLMLLVRSSGDERADAIRRGILQNFGSRLASAAGRSTDEERNLLNAQIVLATAIGIVQLRSGAGVEPLASATEDELTVPLRVVLSALLSKSSNDD